MVEIWHDCFFLRPYWAILLSHQFTIELSVEEDLAQCYIISWLRQETATKIKLWFNLFVSPLDFSL